MVLTLSGGTACLALRGQEQRAPLTAPQGGWGNWAQVIYPSRAYLCPTLGLLAQGSYQEIKRGSHHFPALMYEGSKLLCAVS